MSISADDVKRVVELEDDFGHEMRVGHILSNVKLPTISATPVRIEQPKHGHTYVDPVTGKPRQSDFHFKIAHLDLPQAVYMAIECKNLDANSPAVVCGRPRTDHEAYHNYIHLEPGNIFEKRVDALSLYPPGEFVGKSVLRLKKRSGDFIADNDAEIYDRWSQALASSHGLAKVAAGELLRDSAKACVIPMVVLPNGALWVASYMDDGTLEADPKQVKSCEYFLAHRMQVRTGLNLTLSHIHFLTLDGLKEFIAKFTSSFPRIWGTIFGR